MSTIAEIAELTLDTLQNAVKTAAAFRCRRRLQPAGGEGDKVFPPTFAGAVYAIEKRRVPGREGAVQCVLLDSVQSQANRMEQALQEAVDAGKLELPLLVVDFTAHDPTGDLEADAKAGRLIDRVGRITSLQVPHRLADATLRYSKLGGQSFRKSPRGKALNTASAGNATALFELCPTALVFGMWDSTGPKGGLGAKFERAVVSEIVGVSAEVGDLRRGVRRDPLETSKEVSLIPSEDRTEFRIGEGGRPGGVRPSKLGLSSVPFPEQRDRKTEKNYFDGVTVQYAEQTTTLSLICLRRLRFPLDGAAPRDEVDVAARTVLAALGLAAATLAFEAGTDLRSRCLLWPDGPMVWELLDRPGSEPRKFSLDGEAAVRLLGEAVAVAASEPDARERPEWPPASCARVHGARGGALRNWSGSLRAGGARVAGVAPPAPAAGAGAHPAGRGDTLRPGERQAGRPVQTAHGDHPNPSRSSLGTGTAAASFGPGWTTTSSISPGPRRWLTQPSVGPWKDCAGKSRGSGTRCRWSTRGWRRRTRSRRRIGCRMAGERSSTSGWSSRARWRISRAATTGPQLNAMGPW
jgi:CRISPR-associated protein Csb1